MVFFILSVTNKIKKHTFPHFKCQLLQVELKTLSLNVWISLCKGSTWQHCASQQHNAADTRRPVKSHYHTAAQCSVSATWRARVSTGTMWSQLFLKYLDFSRWAKTKQSSIPHRNTSSLRVRIRSSNRGDRPGSRAPVWCVGWFRRAVTGSRTAPPRPGPEPSPPAGAKTQGRSPGSTSPSCFYRTCKSETAMKLKRSFKRLMYTTKQIQSLQAEKHWTFEGFETKSTISSWQCLHNTEPCGI